MEGTLIKSVGFHVGSSVGTSIGCEIGSFCGEFDARTGDPLGWGTGYCWYLYLRACILYLKREFFKKIQKIVISYECKKGVIF